MGSSKLLLQKISDLESELKSLYKQVDEEYVGVDNSIVEFIPTCIIIVQENKIVFINKAALTLFNGKSKQDLIGQNIFNFVHTDNHAELERKIIGRPGHNKNTFLNVQISTNKNDYVTLEANLTPFVHKKKPATLISGKNISDAILSNKANCEEEKILREEILNSFPELIAFYDPDHKIRWMNNASKQYFKITDDSYIGQDCHFVRFGSEKPCPDCPKYSGNDKASERLINENGKIWLIRHTPLFDKTGNIDGYIEFSTDVTEKEAQKKELIESEQKYREIFEKSQSNIFLLEVTDDLKFKNLDFNPAFEKNTGLKCSELKGKLHGETLSKKALKRANTYYHQCIKEKKAINNIEIELDLPIGKRLNLANIIPIFNENNNVYRILVITRDITEQKQNTQQIELLSFALNNASDAIFVSEENSIYFSYVNDEACKSLEYKRNELMELSILDINPELNSKTLSRLNDDLANENPQIFETHHITKKGHIFPVEITNTYYRYENNTYRLSIVRDISERKRSENALRESEQRYRMVFENSPVSIWEEDLSQVKIFLDKLRFEGVTNIEEYFSLHPEMVQKCVEMVKIENVNQSALNLHKAQSKSELLDRNLTRTLTNKSLETFKNGLIHIWNGSTEMVSDSVVQTLSGELRDVTIYFSVSPGYEESFSKVLVSLVDITKRKQAEATIKESEEKFSTIFKLSPASLSITRLKDNIILDVNDIFLKTHHISKSEVIGHNQNEIDSGIDINSLKPQKSSSSKNENIENYEYQFTDKRGKQEYGLLSMAYITINGEQCVLSQSVMITELKQAEKKLRQREQEYRTLVENSPDIISRFDIESKRVYVNNAYLKISDHTKDEIIGTSPEEISIFPPYAAILIQTLITKVISSAIPDTIDLIMPGANKDLWFNIRAIPEFDNAGQIDSVMTISRDITELKNKYKELTEANKIIKETEQRFREIFDHSHDSIFLLEVINNKEFKFLEVNPQYEKEMGVTRQQCIGKTIEEKIGSEAASVFNAKYQRCINAGTLIEEIIEFDLPQGLRTFHTYLIPIRNKSGNIYRIMGLRRDITEELKAKKALEASKNRLRKAEFVASIGHVEYDFTNNINYWSDGAYEILNIPMEQRKPGKEGFREMIHPDYRENIDSALKKAADDLSKFDEIYKIIDFKGNEKVIHGSGQVQLDEEGNPGNFFGIIQDITQMYDLNAKLNAEEKRFKVLAENAPVGIIIFVDNEPAYTNKEILKILDLKSLNAYNNTRFLEIFNPEDKKKIVELNKNIYAENDNFLHKLTVQTNPLLGDVKYLDFSVTSCKINGKKYVQFIVSDITEEIEKEKQRNQLATDTLYVNLKNNITYEIEAELLKLINRRHFNEEDFNSIFNILQSLKETDKDWALLQKHFDTLHPDFIATLKHINSSLTTTDIKHCACIRLNMDTKEIARFFNVKATSVQTSRVRLKKKLKVPQKVDLRDYILRL